MANLTIEQLIKIILGIFVVAVVVAGVFLFFKFNVIDFFKNVLGGEETLPSQSTQPLQNNQEIEIKELEPSRFCEDCKKNFFDKCSEEECFEIDAELRKFGKKCQFIRGGRWFGRIINPNQCITLTKEEGSGGAGATGEF